MTKYLLFLAVCTTLLFSLSVAQTNLYTETFANGSAQNVWYPGFNGNNMEVEFLSGNPSGDGWVGKLGNDLSGGGVGLSYSGAPTFGDFYLEAQVYIPVGEGTYYGLEFRIDSTGLSSGYQFIARASASTLRFRARTEAVTPIPVVREWSSSEIPGGYPTTSGWHKMAVRAVGDQFWFYFDDQELPDSPITDASFSSGFIGGYVWDFMLAPIYLYIDDIIVNTASSAIGEPASGVATDFQLYQNFPNPFNPTTTIAFDLPTSDAVQVTVFNSLGQGVKSLVSGTMTAGNHQLVWDGRNNLGQEVPAGVYYYQLKSASFSETRKMLLIK